MVVVVSDDVLRKDEPALINALLDEGLEVFHLRKPYAEVSEVTRLLEGISEAHYQRIALHQHHQLAKKFDIRRLHYREEHRRRSEPTERLRLMKQGFHLSTSIHQLEEFNVVSDQFDYAFFGPVFDSISKPGYSATVAGNFELQRKGLKLLAIGGVDQHNVSKAFDMGFSGVAVLGSVWRSPDPVMSYKQIKRSWDQIGR